VPETDQSTLGFPYLLVVPPSSHWKGSEHSGFYGLVRADNTFLPENS